MIITEEKRQALIEHCKTMIAASAFPESLEVATIALASLTAKPSHVMLDGDLVEAYPVPPVPAMPVIVLPRLLFSATTRGEREEMQDVRNDDIAAIKAAGFDVREKGIGE